MDEEKRTDMDAGQPTESDTVVFFGDTVKALGDGRVGGYLVRFTSPDEPDLEAEYFDANTNFGPHKSTPVLYQHGADRRMGKRILDDDAALRPDEVGVWIEAQLELRDAYERFIYEQAVAGKMGWSSGTAAHLVEKEKTKGKVTRISAWPLGLDASITPTPAEPRNAVTPLKSLSLAELELPAEEPPEVAEKATVVKAEVKAEPQHIQEKHEMTEKTDRVEEAQAAQPETPNFEAMIQAALTKVLGDMPAMQKAFHAMPEGKDRPEEKSFGDFLVAIQRGDTKRVSEVYGTYKAQSEITGEAGGYLVPAEYSNSILSLAAERSVVRPRATVIPASSREFNYPVLDYTNTTAGAPAALGGVAATWTEEAGAKTETEAKFKTIKLIYHELSGYTMASNMLRADAGATLEALLRNLFADAIAWYEDYAFLRGDGAAKPLGIFNSPALLTPIATGDDFNLDDAGTMLEVFMTRPDSAGRQNGVWIMHPQVMSDLVELADTAGGNVIWIPNARENLPMTLFGKPVLFSEKIPAGAGSGSTPTRVLLADLSYYLIYSRQQIQIDFSEHYRFINNQGTWRFVSLVDGQPWLQSAPYLADGVTQMSPFVAAKHT
jgi:HK97 family phage major capsid protein